MQEKNDDNLERIKAQSENKIENNNYEPQEINRHILQLTESIAKVKKEIDCLGLKRNSILASLPPEQQHPIKILKIDDSKVSLKLISKIIDEFYVSSPMENSKKKRFGISSVDIYAISKYKPDHNNLPKFGKIFEESINEISSAQGRNDRNIKRTKFSYKSVEKQNNDILKLMEQKRQKYKDTSQAKKEKMDNDRLKLSWEDISKHEIQKFPKIYQKSKNETEGLTKRIATLVQKEIKKKVNKVQRAQKECNFRARKLQKEMLVYWRKREKENADIQKKKDKIENDKKKKEDELQEQIKQKKRMEFLLHQSDIYSLFMYKHLGAYMPNDEKKEEENTTNSLNKLQMDPTKFKEEIVGGKKVLVNQKTNKIVFQSVKVDIDKKKAEEAVENMIKSQIQTANNFDNQLNAIRRTLGGEEVKTTVPQQQPLDALDKPMINNTSSQLIEVPKNFNGELKEYQLKGLRWLDNLYEQGINGILADEMGLGKTIQAIAFLAHLSEEKNNWGPFLVIAPNATLYNWQQEFNRFCPSLKVLPYWGALKERKTLRKFFNSSQLYVKSSAFHVCITSYQLVVTDEKVFHKVNWNYMILDEAQAIKNIASQRWNVLLSFNCRNRLLLSGTPIQNSMSELWALLHFIMPNLFDSHEQFQEWFSKDIEAHSQDKGELNKEQLQRLHKILKPFMLRRVKKDVEHEIGPKVEYEIPCVMTEKQKVLYNSIKEKLSNISDLFMSTDSKVKATNLMNLVMQFRKVCNHPELFERNFGKVPFTFRNLEKDYYCNNCYTLVNGDVWLRCSSESLVGITIPKIVFDFCYKNYDMYFKYSRYCDIYNYENVVDSIYNCKYGLFSFAGIINVQLSDMIKIFKTDMILNYIAMLHFFTKFGNLKYYSRYVNEDFSKERRVSLFISDNVSFYEEDSNVNKNLLNLMLQPTIVYDPYYRLKSIEPILINVFIPKVIAFTPYITASTPQLRINFCNEAHCILISKIFFGVEFKQMHSVVNQKLPKVKIIMNLLNQNPDLALLSNYTFSQIELPSFQRLISDCAKLKELDILLNRLHREGHRVLIFCQMTHMIDILEEYMSKRKYTYFRMDGSTNIQDRRDMINEYQTNPKVFAFLLSTRAGGLGVNLTGADTVIFYDNDWNPTMDAQATDRAHRIGQTKVVSVYRLITAGTIEERILKRAKQKQNVQTTVYSGGAFKAEIFKQNDIVQLLYSEEEMKKMEQDKKRLLLELNDNSEKVAVKKKNKKKFRNEKKSNKRGSKKEEEEKNGKLFDIKQNAIKLDSDDDENNVIIDDGEGDVGNEEGGEDMEIDN